MEGSSAILCQISCLKDMLDQVNEEMESSIQTTREMESEIVKCSEAEAALAAREAELTERLYASQFELVGLAAVTAESRKSVTSMEQELRSLQKKRDEIQERMICKREEFIRQCLEFQRGIDQGEGERLQSLLAEKESLEKEIDIFTKRNHALQSSFSTALKEMVKDLQDSGTGMAISLLL
ncbi:hypothetical protein EUGRSUZ_K02660 [Eucalyptus grandis]|uniref:Uncharacterized protein n=2 Tax=Eucalyptus grandis TaxID=71139 RepID=A0ACC3IWY8_EUCGR|nr:hypothetical protein EUGRSUZ_K02660 [Eucalyptus grandis]